jgi:RHS repeat-associated protein
MNCMNNAKQLAVGLMVLWLATGVSWAQTGNPGNSGGPISGSDQQVQAADLAGKRGQQQVDLFTGSFGYSVPIACAPARNSSEPNLALAYSSAGDNDWCGMGWQLSLGSIERNTRDGFPIAYSGANPPAPLAQYDDGKGFMLNLPGMGGKLFAVATNGSVVEYRSEIDTQFLRCFLDTSANNWTVYDKSGTAYYFGGTTNSRVANPKTGWSGSSGTFRWALDQIVTASGDWTVIAYTNNTSPYTGLSERMLYPTQITYNGHTNVNGYSANVAGTHKIIFQTEARTNDWHFSYRSGFRVELNRRLTNILCQAGSQNVWSYNLKYGVSPATGRSLLNNVVVYGYNGSTPTPYLTNTFAYQADLNAVTFGSTIRWTNMVLNTPGTTTNSYEPYPAQVNSPSGVNYTVADLIDMDGDGLPDRVNYDATNSPNRYLVQKNLGFQGVNGGFGSRYAFGSTSTGAGSVATNSNPFPDDSGYAQLNTPYGRIRDLNGDGLPDRVMDYWWAKNTVLSGNTPYTPYTNYMVQLNTGTNFTGVTNWPVNAGPLGPTNLNADYYYCVESGGVNVGLFDINGDSLPDRVMSSWYTNGPMTNFLVQLNTGTNFTAPRLFGPYRSQNYNNPSQFQPYAWAGIETSEAHMIDINGDGLPDRLMFPMDPNSAGNELHPTTYYAVEYNDGYAFESTNSSTSVAGSADQWPGGSGLETDSGSSPDDAIMNLPYVGLFDINGDGLPDRVMVNWLADTNAGNASTSWLVFLNNGHGFNSNPTTVTNIENQGVHGHSNTPEYWSMQGFLSNYGNLTTLMDIDGDGLLDRVMGVYQDQVNQANSRSNFFLVQLNTSPVPDLLTNINNGIGGTVGVSYNSSSAYDNRVDTSNANSVSRMPYPRQVVAAVIANDGINSSLTTTYGYSGGYYDGTRREFHGFAIVTNTDPTLRYTVNYFHTGGGRNYSSLGEYQDTNAFAKAGMAYRIETYGNDNALYHVTVNQVDQTSLGNGRYFPFVTQSFDCDYPGGGTAKVTATDFNYDINTGNLTNQLEYGLVTGFNPASVGGFTFTDADSTDNRNHNTHFTAIGTYIVDHPDKVMLADGSGNIIREADFSYNSGGTVATKLTRISAGYFATNSYGSYTAYGLPGSITDPVGIQTTITYDSTYNTYPATTTIGGTFTTTTGYDVRSGQVALATDHSGLTVSNSFDSFCRLTEVDQIPIGGGAAVWVKKLSYPATLKAIASGVATNYVDVQVNDGISGAETRTCIDGFGRPVQTRTQAENGNFRVVSIAYDGRGNAFLTTWPVFGTGAAYTKPATTGLIGSWTAFDAAGRAATNRPMNVTFTSGGAFSSVATASGDSGSPLGAQTWSYVNSGDPWWIICTDEDGQVRRYGLDAFGRTNQIQEVDGANTYTGLLKYDLADNLTNLVNANNENIYWAYNDAGGLVAMADPYLGQWTYQRDYANRLRVQTDARGNVIQLSFINPSTGQQDPLGRLQTKLVYSTNYTAHTLALYSAVTNLYDSNGGDSAYTVYPGLLYKTVDREGWEKTGYDARARVIKTTRYLNINSNAYTTSLTLDDGDNVTSTSYPNGGPVITNTFWHGGSINQVSRGGYNYYTASANAFDEFGHTTNFVYGSGLTTTRGYYSVSKRLQNITAGSVFSRTYQYTAGDDVTFLNGTGVTNVTVTYANLHRIKTYTGLSGSYGYDAVGNMTNNIEGGGSSYTYANPRKQAVRTAFGYTNLYDLCGNMVVRHGGTTNAQALSYDPENQLSAFAQAGVVSAEFGYADGGARLWKRVNQNPTNIQVWIGNIYEEKAGKVLFHVFAGSQQVCTFETNSPLMGGSDTNKVGYYYHQDSLNSSSALSSSSGAQVEVNAFYPFGRNQTASPQASFQVSRRFTGQIYDAECGFYFFSDGRSYGRPIDVELGRAMQADDRIPDLSNPQSWNRYSYVMNNPLRYNDPSGHEPGYTGASGRAMLQAEDDDATRVVQSAHESARTMTTVMKTAVAITPAGTAMGIQEAVTGKEAYSGDKLTAGQRAKSGALAAVPGVIKVGGKVLKAAEEGSQIVQVVKAGWHTIPKSGIFQMAEKQYVMGLVKDGKIVALADPIKAGVSHLQMAKEIGLDVASGKLPNGVESFLAEKVGGAIKVVGGGISNFKISSDASQAVEKVLK